MSEFDDWGALRFAPPYDQNRRALSTTATFKLVQDALALTADLRTRGQPPRRRRKARDQVVYEAVVNALVAALVHRELTKPKGWTRVPLSKQRLGTHTKGKRDRYKSPAMSRSLRHVVWELEYRGWLELEPGRPGCTDRDQSRMRASKALAHEIGALGCKLTDFTSDPDQELIILKGRKPPERDGRGRSRPASWIDYNETADTEAMREEMRELNCWLASLDLDYLGDGHGVDPIGGRTMRRIFNNGSFSDGGRLFGGFWDNMPMKKPHTDGPWRGHCSPSGPAGQFDLIA
jgi:hypothetical protein